MARVHVAGEKIPVSVYIICLNEAANIGRCLESCRDFAEIIVVDSGSTDATCDIIKSYRSRGWPVTLLHQDWLGYSGQKQFALDHCTNAWCLNLDADEEMTPELVNEIPQLIARSDVDGWKIGRRETLFPRGLAHAWTHRSKLMRLFRRAHGRYDLSLKVHEHVIVDGPVRSARTYFQHNAVISWAGQMEKDNLYSSLKAAQNFDKNKRPSYLRLIFVGPLAFIKIYIISRYCLNGLEGFNRAVLAGIYAYAKEAKLFELYRQNAASQHRDEVS